MSISRSAAMAASVLVVSASLFLSAGGKPGGRVETPMTASFSDDSAYHIMSDGLGPYVDDVDSVYAIIDWSGDFDLKTNYGQRPELRKLFFDFSAPALVGSVAPFLNGHEAAFLSTSAGSLLDMGVLTWKMSEAQLFFTLDGANWFIRFMPSLHPGTNHVKITRTDSSTWVIEAAPDAAARLVSRPIKGKSIFTDHGSFYMPFRLTATKKPL